MELQMSRSLVDKYSKPVPRYTSYPTAPHFHQGIDQTTYHRWLDELSPKARASLYLHLPFCDRLCWFCGCHTKQTNRYGPVAAYLEALTAEMRHIGRRLGPREVTALHWGGGSPSLIAPADIVGTTQVLREAFNISPAAEFSVELDPNDMDENRFDAWATAGLTRASLGVQDFDPVVQRAINRIQTLEQTREVVDAVRARGVNSVNIDMLYGLPHQTVAGAVQTANMVMSMSPDRVALFGYAHVPWVKKHQSMIDSEALPGAFDRFDQAEAAAEALKAGGYVQVGMDHFSLPHDSLAKTAIQGKLHRNFQGYTVDAHEALIGLGASAIGRLPQGYVQNVVSTHEYQRRALATGDVIDRGVSITGQDAARSFAIERIMCDFSLEFEELRTRYGGLAEPIIEDAIDLAMQDTDGIVALLPGRLAVTEVGRPFVRTVASTFDAYLGVGAARYSRAV
jgi:oxygen-independent coproporphyrinogen-3 oxidase